jgi:RecA-family ATPase
MVCALDPIYKLMDGKDERLGVDVAPVLGCLETISENAKCSTGFAQHFAKGNQALKFAIDRVSGSNYFARDADVLFIITELAEEDTFSVDIIQRSFPEIQSFGIRWKHPLFVRDDSIDITNIRQPGKEKKETDPVKDRMLAALHAANYEGGLTFTEWLRAVQVKRSGKITPAKKTFCRKLKELIDKEVVEKSIATEKYLLSVNYSQSRANYFNAEEEEVSHK